MAGSLTTSSTNNFIEQKNIEVCIMISHETYLHEIMLLPSDIFYFETIGRQQLRQHEESFIWCNLLLIITGNLFFFCKANSRSLVKLITAQRHR